MDSRSLDLNLALDPMTCKILYIYFVEDLVDVTTPMCCLVALGIVTLHGINIGPPKTRYVYKNSNTPYLSSLMSPKIFTTHVHSECMPTSTDLAIIVYAVVASLKSCTLILQGIPRYGSPGLIYTYHQALILL